MKPRTSRLTSKTSLRRAPGPDRPAGTASRDARRRAPRKPIRKVSPRRAIEQRIYDERRPLFLADKVCRICEDHKTGALPVEPDGPIRFAYPQPASEVHHMRGRVGPDFLDETTWCPLDHDHHEFVTREPKWAEDHGYSLSRNNIREDAA